MFDWFFSIIHTIHPPIDSTFFDVSSIVTRNDALTFDIAGEVVNNEVGGKKRNSNNWIL